MNPEPSPALLGGSDPSESASNVPLTALRRAADHMREHHADSHPRYGFWHSLAAWLDTFADKEAARVSAHVAMPVLYLDHAKVVANAYLASVGDA